MKRYVLTPIVMMMLNAGIAGNAYSSDTAAAIETANQAFEAAFAGSDAAGLAALYTRGAQLLPPNSEIVSGSEGIQTFWQGAIDMGIKTAGLETIELEEHGDTAIEVGRYTLNAGDGQLIDQGKYIVIWKNEDNAWKLHRDMWSSVSAPQ